MAKFRAFVTRQITINEHALIEFDLCADANPVIRAKELAPRSRDWVRLDRREQIDVVMCNKLTPEAA
jgi:hypothetical protein